MKNPRRKKSIPGGTMSVMAYSALISDLADLCMGLRKVLARMQDDLGWRRVRNFESASRTDKDLSHKTAARLRKAFLACLALETDHFVIKFRAHGKRMPRGQNNVKKS